MAHYFDCGLPMGFSAFVVLLAAIAILYPEDSLTLADWFTLRIRLVFANANLLIRSYIIYRKLKSDFERMQLPVPPFQFVPIQHRD